MNSTLSIIVMIISSFFAALGQVGLKMGSMKLKIRLSHLIQNYELLMGLAFYGVATVVGIIALKGNDLTVLYPIASLNYVWVSLLSMKFLNEKMNKYKWLGIVLIMLGVLIIV